MLPWNNFEKSKFYIHPSILCCSSVQYQALSISQFENILYLKNSCVKFSVQMNHVQKFSITHHVHKKTFQVFDFHTVRGIQKYLNIENFLNYGVTSSVNWVNVKHATATQSNLMSGFLTCTCSSACLNVSFSFFMTYASTIVALREIPYSLHIHKSYYTVHYKLVPNGFKLLLSLYKPTSPICLMLERLLLHAGPIATRHNN